MEQKWKHILVILVFYQRITTGAFEKILKQGQSYNITCQHQRSVSTYYWLRALDTPDMEFIASFDMNKIKEKSSTFSTSFNHRSRGQSFILTLRSFDKNHDSGIYGCAFLKANKIAFDGVTRLVGEKVEVLTQAPVEAMEPTPCTTAKPCVCGKTREHTYSGETDPSMLCSPIILGPLAGGCGLLLLLLIITTLYCNKIRTRRCPHHYKRKPRPMPPGKQMMTNRPI